MVAKISKVVFDTLVPHIWRAPPGVNHITVTGCGGGGGGGAGGIGLTLGALDPFKATCGGGGGGAAFTQSINYTVTPGSTYNIIIGAGGEGGSGNFNSSTGNNGSYGASSIFDQLVFSGGRGGDGGTRTSNISLIFALGGLGSSYYGTSDPYGKIAINTQNDLSLPNGYQISQMDMFQANYYQLGRGGYGGFADEITAFLEDITALSHISSILGINGLTYGLGQSDIGLAGSVQPGSGFTFGLGYFISGGNGGGGAVSNNKYSSGGNGGDGAYYDGSGFFATSGDSGSYGGGGGGGGGGSCSYLANAFYTSQAAGADGGNGFIEISWLQ